MPRYSIWIQKEDNAKWLAIKDRPKFLHEAIDSRKKNIDLNGYRWVCYKALGNYSHDWGSCPQCIEYNKNEEG